MRADHSGAPGTPQERTDRDGQTLKFHYNREERLKKLRSQLPDRPRRPFLPLPRRTRASKGRRRVVFLLFVDVLLIFFIVYLLVKPSNLFLSRLTGDLRCELNVTAMRGRKTLVGFTIKNEKSVDVVFSEAVPVSLRIDGKSGVLTFSKQIEAQTVLLPGESTALVFLLDTERLPRAASLELYYGAAKDPLFSKHVRF